MKELNKIISNQHGKYLKDLVPLQNNLGRRAEYAACDETCSCVPVSDFSVHRFERIHMLTIGLEELSKLQRTCH